jgi:hypothetical protein
MTRFQDLPIERKLLHMSLWSAGAALILACAAFVAFDLFTFRHVLAQRLTAYADIIGSNSASAVVFNDAKVAERNLQGLEARTGVEAAAIYTAQGNIFAAWSRGKNYVSFPRPVEPGVEEIVYGFSVLEVYQPVLLEGSPVGTVYIRARMTEVYERLQRYLWIASGVLLLSVLLAALISRPLGRRISRPRFDLAEAAKRK